MVRILRGSCSSALHGYSSILEFIRKIFSITASLSWARGTSRCTMNGLASATETSNIGFLIHVIEKQTSHICENCEKKTAKTLFLRKKKKKSEQLSVQII